MKALLITLTLLMGSQSFAVGAHTFCGAKVERQNILRGAHPFTASDLARRAEMWGLTPGFKSFQLCKTNYAGYKTVALVQLEEGNRAILYVAQD